MANEPIEGTEFLSGVKVVDIGDLRVARGLTRRPVSACRHISLLYDSKERRVWCRDCETDVDGFDAFRILVEHFSAAWAGLEKRSQRLAEAETFQLRTRAAKAIDEAWRSHSMIPVCPTCRHGLFPEDFKDGVPAMINRKFAAARRAKAEGDRNG